MQQPYQGAPHVHRRSNRWAVAAIGVAGVAFVLGWVPFLGFLLGAGAVALGIVAIVRARPLDGRGTGLGITSTVLGGLAAATSVLVTVFALAVGPTPGTGEAAQPAAVTTPPGAPAPASEPVDPPAPAPEVGTPVVSGDLTFTVTAFTCGIERVGDQYLGADAQGQYCQVDLSVLNNGQRASYFTSSQATLLSVSGQEFSASSDSIYLDGAAGLLEQINPGNTLSGSLLFDVPDGADLSRIELRDGVFDEAASVPV